MMLPLVPIGVAVIAVLVWVFVRRMRPTGYPPGPMSLPIIGNIHQLGRRPFIKFMEMEKKYGSDILAIDFGGYRGVVLNSHKAIREALNKPEFQGRPKLRPFIARSGGRPAGIAANEGEAWMEHRRFTLKHLPDFGFGKQSMESLIHDEVQQLLRTLTKLQGQPTKTENIFNMAFLNCLWWIIVGERFDHSDEKLQKIVAIFTDGLGDSPAAGAFFFFPWLTKIAPKLSGYNSFMDFQFESIAFVRKKIEQEKVTFKKGQHRHFLDVYLEAVFNEKDSSSSFFGKEGEHHLLYTITDLFFAGIETTSTMLSWTVMLLVVYPEVQEKLFAEIESVVGTSRLPNLDDEPSLPYTRAVFNEVSRFSSIFPLSVFHSTTSDATLHGYRIPKDTMIMPNLYAANRDPEVWTDSESFMPERFLDTNGSIKSNSNLVLTFSTGRRICPGETLARKELFLCIASIFQRFKIEPNPAHPKPVIDYTPTTVMHAKPYEYVFKCRGQY